MKNAFLLAAFSGSLALAHAQTVPKGDIVVDVETFARLPTSDNGQTARANVLTSSPDGRIFANDQRGLLYTISADGQTVTQYLNLNLYTPLLFDNGERGFQSFAFHPDFNTPGTPGFGKFYTMGSQSDVGATPTFTPGVAGAGRDHDEVMLEWTVADPAAAVFTPADAAHPFRQVLRIVRPNSNHNAGFLSFNPTAGPGSADRGNLYVGTGDSGGGGDPLNLSQAPGKVYGAVLRINPLASGVAPYQVPADNPYVTQPGLLPEKYAGGFRNPQRFTWDPKNGRMFISDIGQNNVEEIDLGQPGANYGWNQREGDFIYNSDGSVGASARGDSAASGFTYPVAEYRHFGSIGNAVSAGPVIRGKGLPALAGRLIFSDFVTGTPYTIVADTASSDGAPSTVTELRLRQNGVEMSFEDMIRQINPSATRADLRFGTDIDRRVYLLDKQDGVIRRLVSVEKPTVSATIDQASISQGAGQVAHVTFSRTGDVSAPLAVTFRFAGQAVNGVDYAQAPTAKTIKAGRNTASLRIAPLPSGVGRKIRVELQPSAGYRVNAEAEKVKVLIAR